MMLLLSMEDNLKVLPIHRLLRGADGKKIMGLRGFEVEDVEGGLGDLLARMKTMDDEHVFGLYDGGYRMLKLKDKKLIDEVSDPGKSAEWNALDANLLQSLIIAPALACDVKDAIEAEDLAFIKAVFSRDVLSIIDIHAVGIGQAVFQDFA